MLQTYRSQLKEYRKKEIRWQKNRRIRGLKKKKNNKNYRDMEERRRERREGL